MIFISYYLVTFFDLLTVLTNDARHDIFTYS